MNINDNDLSRILISYYFFKFHCTAHAVYKLNYSTSEILSSEAHLIMKNSLEEFLTSLPSQFKKITPLLKLKHQCKAEYLEKLELGLKDVCLNIGSTDNFFLYLSGPAFITALLTTSLQSIATRAYFSSANLDNFADDLLDALSRNLKELDHYDPKGKLLFFSELGTRRRLSLQHQLKAIKLAQAICPKRILGTGNPYIADELGIEASGLIHHDVVLAEYAKLCKPSTLMAERRTIENWIKLFEGEYLVPVTDTFGLDNFINALDENLIHKIKAVRHDSGCPIKWCQKMAEHFENHNISPNKRIFIFTDSLNWDALPDIHSKVKSLCVPKFGLGANFTGSQDANPLRASIKLIHIYEKFVSKNCDDAEKNQKPSSIDLEIMNSGETITAGKL